MANVAEVAKYILENEGDMTPLKLQKLVYYSQAWSTVWDDHPLFDDDSIQAWRHGPVVPSLYQLHRGRSVVHASDMANANSKNLTPGEKSTIDVVLNFYGNKEPWWLRDLTHSEDPWIKARERAGADIGDNSTEEITIADMMEYYGSL